LLRRRPQSIEDRPYSSHDRHRSPSPSELLAMSRAPLSVTLAPADRDRSAFLCAGGLMPASDFDLAGAGR
jgi:hypothetical protein